MRDIPNELHPELLGVASLNPWSAHDSSSRALMFGAHLSQALVVHGATPRRTLTGMEREFGKATFNIKFPVNAEVLRVVQKYPPSYEYGAIKQNPLTTVIYEDMETKRIGVLDIPRFSCKHQHFGFTYKHTKDYGRLASNVAFAKGTVLADSPNLTPDGDYMYGVHTQVAYMSIPGVIEDGVVISKAYAEKLKSTGYETRTASWGKDYYPLNLYGNDTLYKPFPDIGDKIRDDGLLFALREYNDLLAPVEMSPSALKTPMYPYDKLVYAKPGARVIDINVRHAISNSASPTPTGMETHAAKYYSAQLRYYNAILETYNDLRNKQKRQGRELSITPELHRLLVEAIAYKGDSGRNKPKLMVQLQELDDWRVDVTFEYDILPKEGFKLTGTHGNKGVVCQVWETEDMPVDQYGNRAEIIMDGDSITKRMNLGCLYEVYINGTSAKIDVELKNMRQAISDDAVFYAKAWALLLRYYEIVSPKMHELLTGSKYKGGPKAHVDAVLADGIHLHLPTDNERSSIGMISMLAKEFPLNIGPVTYRGRSGNMVTTKAPVLIGGAYLMLLEKTGEDWSGVASAKRQVFGVLARITKHDKYSAPARPQPVRVWGESEVRLAAAVIGGEAIAEQLEMANSPVVHKESAASILRSEVPSNIEAVIDRTRIAETTARNLVYVRHALETGGARFATHSDADDTPYIYPPKVKEE